MTTKEQVRKALEAFKAWLNCKASDDAQAIADDLAKNAKAIEVALQSRLTAPADAEVLKLGMAFRTKGKKTPCYLVGFVCGGNPLLRFDETEEYAQSFQSLPLSYLVREPKKDICDFFPQKDYRAATAPRQAHTRTAEGGNEMITSDTIPDSLLDVGYNTLSGKEGQELAMRRVYDAAITGRDQYRVMCDKLAAALYDVTTAWEIFRIENEFLHNETDEIKQSHSVQLEYETMKSKLG